MKMNSAGQLVLKETDMIEALYQGKTADSIVVEDTKWIKRYNNLVELFDFPDSKIDYEVQSGLSSNEFVEQCVGPDSWSMPDEYKQLDIKNYLLSDLTCDVKIARVKQEYQEFEKRNMIPVLQFLVYFLKECRQKGVVLGVGRGSSVASYILFLIGAHKIDSIKYDLDIKEFLK